MADNVTAQDIKNFYVDGRAMYRRLVVDSGRDIVGCMHAIALWIFLEGMGFPNIVQKLLRTHDMVVNMDEAVLCLGWVESVIPPAPVVNGWMPINLTLVYRNKMNILAKVNQIVFESFSIAFDDIIQEVSGMSFAQLNVQPLIQDQHDARRFPYHYPQQAAPAVVGPSAYNSVFQCKPLHGLVSTDRWSLAFAGGSASSVPRNLPNHTLLEKEEDLPEIQRAIFFTFLWENPVQKKELESYLERSFGEGCIEKVTTQQVPENEQPLWASVVFYSEIPMLAIMQGRETAPMTINEKKVWAGKEWL
ncbi:hypothetical protein MKX01_014388 [Papaver californicum]|nr:hypothetical protein MKX01_014388 [Papaver californicum]